MELEWLPPVISVVVFVVSALVGYLVINKVPPLLHTPLMSGMNALSGITILGSICSTAAAIVCVNKGLGIAGQILGGVAIVLAMINVVGGFGVTHRMLRMFNKKKGDKKK